VGNRFLDCALALDELDVFQNANCLAQVEDAIKIALCKYRVSIGKRMSCLPFPVLRFNRHFFVCLEQCGAFRKRVLAQSTLRAVVEAIEDIQMADVHAIRSGPGPEEAQVTRGKDLAWRRDIDREYHLHYWQCKGNVKELACIVPHRDMHICG